MADPASVARFGSFEFDVDRMVLRERGRPVPLQPQPAQVLALLLQEPGRLVTRAEFRATVWRERVVEFDAGLNFSIRQIRRALGDHASAPTYVETVHRRGYRFIAPVQASSVRQTRPWRAPGSRVRLAAKLFVAGAVVLLTVGVIREIVAGSGREGSTPSLPEPTRTTYRAARWLTEQGDHERALVRLDSVRLAAPRFAAAWALTARTRLRLGDVPAARMAAERAVQLDGGMAEAHFWLGRTRFMEVRPRHAVEAFRRAVELNPDEPVYRQWYAQALANVLQFDEAIAELETVRQLDPVANIVGVDLAAVYLAAGRYQDAGRFCSQSLELVPTAELWARDCLMSVHHFRGDSSGAIAQARALMALNGAADTTAAAVGSVLAYFKWDLGRIDSLGALGEELNPFLRVRATARLRDRRATLRGLASMGADRHFGLQWAPRDVWLRFLHGDAVFEAILTEADLPIP